MKATLTGALLALATTTAGAETLLDANHVLPGCKKFSEIAERATNEELFFVGICVGILDATDA
jgi:hypothetical protein